MGALALVFVVLQFYIFATSELIFDVTNVLNNKKISFALENEYTSSKLGFYYKTELDLNTFVEEELKNVLAVLDERYMKYWKHAIKPPQLFLEVNLKTTVLGDGSILWKNFTTAPEVINRVSAIVITEPDLSCDTIKTHFEMANIVSYIENNLNPSIKTVFSYTHTKDNCSAFYSQVNLLHASFIIVNYEIDVVEFVPSHEIFKTYLQDYRELLFKSNFNPKFIYWIKNKKSSGATIGLVSDTRVLRKYKKFMLSIALQLSQQSGQLHIVDPFNLDTHFLGGISSNLTKFVIPKFHFGAYNNSTLKAFEIANDVFPTMYIDQDHWKCFLFCGGYTNHTLNESCCLWGKNKYSVSMIRPGKFDLMLASKVSEIQSISEVFATQVATIKTLVITSGSNYVTGDDLILLNKYKKHVDIACEIDFGDLTRSNDADNIDPQITFHENNTPYCKPIFNMTTYSSGWRFSISLKEFYVGGGWNEYNLKPLFRKLNFVDEERLKFLEKSPNKTVMLHFDAYEYKRSYLAESPTLYCDEDDKISNYLIEALLNWAAMRNVRIIVNNLNDETFTSSSVITWFKYARLPASLLQPVKTYYPIIQSQPSSIAKWFGNLTKCIVPTDKISKLEVPFFVNTSRITFTLNINNTSLSNSDISTVLPLIESKLHRLVIIIDHDAQIIKRVLKAIENIPQVSKRLTSVYLEVQPLKQVDLHLEKLIHYLNGDSTSSSVGVHFLFTKEMNPSNLKDFESAITKTNFPVFVEKGVGFVDCVSALNYFLEDEVRVRTVFKEFTYIVCHETDTIANNLDKWRLNDLFEGHLVIKNTFKELFSRIKVHFQLFPKTTKPEDFLKFINDVDQFAMAHDTSYFLCPEDALIKTSGWWGMTTLSDLSNPSVHFVNETGSGSTSKIIPESGKIFPDESKILTWVFCVGIIVFVAVVFVTIFFWRREKKKNRENKERLPLKPLVSKYSGMGFNTECEIPKVEQSLNSCQILGMGNFGTVFKASFRNTLVAVKIPLDGCSNEAFNSLLIEAKLLSYIGNHMNVIQFVGAYVKEVDSGLIQIATALCENGSLLSFLRAKRNVVVNADRELEINEVDHRDLVQFSKGIAAGMVYISSKNVIHGDLSARNILLDANNVCKISDFGLSRKLYEYNKYVKKSHTPLPWRWLAIESLAKMEFTTKSDVWGYGVTLWEIFSLGDIPYSGLTWRVDFAQNLRNGMRLTSPRFATSEIFSWMFNCWNLEPEDRPDFSDVYEFFFGLANEDYSVLHEI